MRLSYQGTTSCSVLVDGNVGTGGDSPETLNSPNHTKTSEHTGRWGNSRNPGVVRARNKRSLLDDRQPQYHDDQSPLHLLSGDGSGGGGVEANGDGDGRAVTVHDDVNPVNRLSSGTLYARTNKALPKQMYDAMMLIASHQKVKSAAPVRQPQQPVSSRRHKKRQADLVVYRKDPNGRLDDDMTDEVVNFVPLDSEHRIRVNLTIASDDGSAGGPTYAVSLSLPSSASAAVDRHPQPPEMIQDIPSDTSAVEVQPISLLAGSECQCYCPCLDQDQENDDPQNVDLSTTDILISSTPPTIMSTDDNNTSTTEFWTTTTTSFGTSEPIDVSCPPPVLLFCEQGKHVYTFII